MPQNKVSNLRQNYIRHELLEENIERNPFRQFEVWLDDAINSSIIEPNAMFLATVANNRPSGRVVLLKGFDEHGFVFYSNYESNKAIAIDKNAYVSITFFWDLLERQVRVEGNAIKVPEIVSDEYFATRPRGSQLGALASKQSNTIANRSFLEDNLAKIEAKYKDQTTIQRPKNWGGYQIIPDSFEFWQGRSNRLHDRLLYSKLNDNWQLTRLEP